MELENRFTIKKKKSLFSKYDCFLLMKKSVRSVTVLQNHYELVPARLCGLLEPKLLNLYTCLPPDIKLLPGPFCPALEKLHLPVTMKDLS